jgi:hypothetical protein
MKLKNIQIGFVSLLLLLSGAEYSLAALELSIAKNMTVSDEQMTIPIKITGVLDEEISGYKIRLDYDDTHLTNPVAILDDTLSAGKDVQSNTPQDDKGGKFVIVLFSGFTAIKDGVLVKIQLDVDQGFTSSDISFITSETALIDASFEQLDYSASDGVLSVKYQTSSVHSIPTLNEWGLMIFSSILLLMSIMCIKYQVKRVS